MLLKGQAVANSAKSSRKYFRSNIELIEIFRENTMTSVLFKIRSEREIDLFVLYIF